MNESAKKGRKMIIAIIAAGILFSLTAIVTYIINLGFGNLPTQLVRFLLTIALCSGLYKGKKLAKGLFIILYGAAALAGFMSLSALQGHVFAFGFYLAFSLVFSLCCVALIVSKDIQEYMLFMNNQSMPVDK